MLFKMKIQVKAVRDSMKRMIKAWKQLVHGESSDDLSQPDQSESSSIGIQFWIQDQSLCSNLYDVG